MKKVGDGIEYFNLNKKKETNKGYRFVILSESGDIESFPSTIKTESCWMPDGNTVWLYVVTYPDKSKDFYFEDDGAVFILERVKNAEAHDYTSEGTLYYKKDGQWYSFMPNDDDDILLGQMIIPDIFVRKAENGEFVVTQELLRSSKTINCKSYIPVKDESGKNMVLLGDVDKEREYYVIVDDLNPFISYDRGYVSIIINGEEHSFYRKPETGLWFTSGLKTPEMLYDFCEE